jgi:acetyl-CoA carboxylase biotin carboxyl carrier protein
MGGKVVDVKVKAGDSVLDGETVVVIESMKMEVPIVANAAGTVKEIRCGIEDVVDAKAVLLLIE